MRLQDLVAVGSLGLRVRACASELSRGITWVHTTDLRDPSPYLRGGELILTTGVWRHRRSDSDPFVTALARVGVAGLCYGLPRPTARGCPPDLVDACERHRLPLLEADYDLPFIAIERAVVERFSDDREQSLRSVIKRNDTLLRAVIAGSGADAALSLLASVTGAPAWLIVPGGQIAAATSPWPADEHPIDVWRRAGSDPASPIALPLGGSTVTAYAAASLGSKPAYLIHGRMRRTLSIEERSTVSQVLAFLALELAHRQVLAATERRLAAHLLRLVEAGDADTTELSARLQALGVDTGIPLAALVAGGGPAADAEVDTQADMLRGFLAGHRAHAVVARTTDDAIGCIFGWDQSPASLEEIAHEALAALGDICEDAAVGVGTLAPGIRSLRESFVQARHAQRVAARRPTGARFATHREIDTSGLLLDLHDPELCSAFATAVLGSIQDHDRRHGTALVTTVQRFLATGGRWESTATELGVHVNTLRQRLARIEQITGRDLRCTQDRVDLHLALRVRARESPAARSSGLPD